MVSHMAGVGTRLFPGDGCCSGTAEGAGIQAMGVAWQHLEYSSEGGESQKFRKKRF